MIVGIDLGYGQVKAVTDGCYIKFPSVVGVPSAMEYKDVALSDRKDPVENIELIYESKRYYVGQKALEETNNARLTLKADKSDRETNKVKFLAALGLLNINEVEVITGLPVFEYESYKDRLAESLNGEYIFKLNSISRSINIQSVRVIPQAGGAYYDLVLDQEGQIINKVLISGRTAVVDIGFRTTDVATLERARYDANQSFTIWAGVGKIHQEVQKYLQREYKLSYPLSIIDSIVRQGVVNLYGVQQPIDEYIRAAVEPVAQEILESFIAGIDDYRKLTSGIVLTGGGVALVAPYFEAEFGDAVTIVNNPEYSNASGYYKYGRLINQRR